MDTLINMENNLKKIINSSNRIVLKVGSSILMTSAPWSTSIIVQYGPESIRVKSSTRRPDNIPGFILN